MELGGQEEALAERHRQEKKDLIGKTRDDYFLLFIVLLSSNYIKLSP